MRRTRVRVRVEFEDCDVRTAEGDAIGVVSPAGDGCFEIDFDASLDLDIDTNETALTRACSPALRDALRARLAHVAKKRALKAAGTVSRVVSCTPYPVDSEIGRFRIPTYEVQGARATVRTRDMFPPIRGKEYYPTKGFREIALLDGTVDSSYRKTSGRINRIRHQVEGGTPATTLHGISEEAGTKIIDSWTAEAKKTLAENGFSADGTSLADEKRVAELKNAVVEGTEHTAAEQLEAAKTVGIPYQFRESVKANAVPYDRPETVVDISVDAVLTKKQKESRNGDASEPALAVSNDDTEGGQADNRTTAKKAKRKRRKVSDKVAKLRCDGISYCMVASTYTLLFSIVLAFLLRNRLHGRVLCFFVDGERSLNNALLAAFSWHSRVRVILDWYHLTKKCADMLSRALNDTEIRRKHLSQMKHILWYGAVDEAIAYLREIDSLHVKEQAAIETLVGYLVKHREHIPCYAIRKQLGLRNSSNSVEKANDELVSNRQKKHGMSWSKEGSVALAALTAVNSNGHRRAWLDSGSIPLEFAEAA